MFDKFAMADKKKEALERQVCQLEWSDNCHKKLNYSSRSRMQWTISTSGAQEGRATSTQTPTVSRYKTSGRRNMLQQVLQVGGDIQMSLDINEAIKEDIQVSVITS